MLAADTGGAGDTPEEELGLKLEIEQVIASVVPVIFAASCSPPRPAIAGDNSILFPLAVGPRTGGEQGREDDELASCKFEAAPDWSIFDAVLAALLEGLVSWYILKAVGFPRLGPPLF